MLLGLILHRLKGWSRNQGLTADCWFYIITAPIIVTSIAVDKFDVG